MTIGIIDYGLGNLRSVFSAVEKVGFKAFVSNKKYELRKADKLILPGVGAFADGMNNLSSLGLIEELNETVIKNKKPVLGICLGAQMMAKESLEFGRNAGLGWLDAQVVKLNPADLPIPHVGWNELNQVKDNILFEGIPQDALFYYVHSFHIKCVNLEDVTGQCGYGINFAASFKKDNIYAVQFHPEKSQLYGLKLLKNFLEKA